MTENNSILIVDDVPENLRLLSALLLQNGYQVRSATSAKRALAAAALARPSLILLDIRMPEMTGMQMCDLLKKDDNLKDIPVIFISGLNETGDKINAFRSGGVDYITKPIQEQEVLARVKTHLELRRQKIELETSYRRLQALEELRDSLTHMIVHDMKNPLMVIGGHLELIGMKDAGTLSPHGDHSLAEARVGVSRLTHMISEMLTVSKLESGKLAIQPGPCDLVALARKVAAEVCPANDDRQIEISITTNPETVRLSLDVGLIERVLQNLLGNALKFSPDRSKVALTIAAANGRTRVEVSDAGPGIAPEFHRMIFEKFGQVASGKNVAGYGLGLTFCKLAVEAHGGTIGVESRPGAGATFGFTLNG